MVITIIVSYALLPFNLDRPQYFSFLFTALIMILLQKFKGNPKSAKPLLFIPLIMLFWSNMHGGFVFGLIVLLLFTITEALKFLIAKIKLPFSIDQAFSKKSIMLLLLTSLLAIIFSYFNPNANSAFLITIESHSTTKWLFSMVREYMSPIEEARFPYSMKLSNMSFWTLLGLVYILTLLNIMRKKVLDPTKLLLIFFSTCAALTSMRYIPFFLATALPLISDYRFFKDYSFLKDVNKQHTISLFLSIIFIISFLYVKDYKNIFKIKSQSYYPEKAVNFLLSKHDLYNTRMFNSINMGSYLLWKLYPQYKVFQDTRYLSYEVAAEGDSIRFALESPLQSGNQALVNALSKLIPNSIGKISISYNDNLNNIVNNSKPFWKSLLEKYNIDLIVHEATTEFTGIIFPLTLRLLKDDEWVLIYLDGNLQIFVRNNGKYAEIIRKFKKPKELIYDEIILETTRLIRKKTTYPTPYSSLAFALMMKGKDEDAKKMIDAALELDKKDLVANFCLAYLALKQQKNKALTHLAKETSHVSK
ncbi:MAG: tetratricopeptide repeat protein [Thermodesulfovibrionales bacterium]